MKLQGALHWCTNIKVAKVVEFKDNQERFCAMTLSKKLVKVIHAYTPSKMMMVYMKICTLLHKQASLDFFCSPKKGRANLATLIWENRESLRKIQYE